MKTGYDGVPYEVLCFLATEEAEATMKVCAIITCDGRAVVFEVTFPEKKRGRRWPFDEQGRCWFIDPRGETREESDSGRHYMEEHPYRWDLLFDEEPPFPEIRRRARRLGHFWEAFEALSSALQAMGLERVRRLRFTEFAEAIRDPQTYEDIREHEALMRIAREHAGSIPADWLTPEVRALFEEWGIETLPQMPARE